MKRRISILGSTGSIGTQTLDIVRDHNDTFNVSAITGNKNIKLLEEQAREFSPELVCVADETSAKVHNGVLLQKSDAVVVNFCELFEGFLRGHP